MGGDLQQKARLTAAEAIDAVIRAQKAEDRKQLMNDLGEAARKMNRVIKILDHGINANGHG